MVANTAITDQGIGPDPPSAHSTSGTGSYDFDLGNINDFFNNVGSNPTCELMRDTYVSDLLDYASQFTFDGTFQTSGLQCINKDMGCRLVGNTQNNGYVQINFVGQAEAMVLERVRVSAYDNDKFPQVLSIHY